MSQFLKKKANNVTYLNPVESIMGYCKGIYFYNHDKEQYYTEDILILFYLYNNHIHDLHKSWFEQPEGE